MNRSAVGYIYISVAVGDESKQVAWVRGVVAWFASADPSSQSKQAQ
jgi:hypothetical protein